MASLKDQYKNQKDRIRKAYKDILRSGAVFDKSFEEIVGQRPKKITQGSINKLRKITKDDLWRMARNPDTGESGWKERTRRREEGSRIGGKAAQAKRRKPKKPPIEPEPIPIGEDDGSMFYENLLRTMQENVGEKPLLNELIDLLNQLHDKLSKENFSRWADDDGDELTELVETIIRYYGVQSIRMECFRRAKALMQNGLRKYGASENTFDSSDSYTDESGETWMNISVLEDDDEAFMNW